MKEVVGTTPVTKHAIRDAINAADDWVDANLADFTATIPEEVRGGTKPLTLLANSAGVARGAGPQDVAEGIADRNQAGVLLSAYTTASSWLNTKAVDYLSVIGQTGAFELTMPQSFHILESVCRKKAQI
jgi:hypothetical protein